MPGETVGCWVVDQILQHTIISDGKSMVVDLVDWRVNARINKTIYCIIIYIYTYSIIFDYIYILIFI